MPLIELSVGDDTPLRTLHVLQSALRANTLAAIDGLTGTAAHVAITQPAAASGKAIIDVDVGGQLSSASSVAGRSLSPRRCLSTRLTPVAATPLPSSSAQWLSSCSGHPPRSSRGTRSPGQSSPTLTPATHSTARTPPPH
jgi:hypothetical protein